MGVINVNSAQNIQGSFSVLFRLSYDTSLANVHQCISQLKAKESNILMQVIYGSWERAVPWNLLVHNVRDGENWSHMTLLYISKDCFKIAQKIPNIY